MAARGKPFRVLLAVVALGVAAACTSEPDEPDDPSAAFTDPVTPDVRSESPSTDPSPAPTTRPLVLAVHPRRPPIDVTADLAERIMEGSVDDWRALGQPPGPLRVTERTDRLDDLAWGTIAVVVGDAATPQVRVLSVDGVHPLRDPDAYPVQVQGPAPAPATTLTVVGDIMLGRAVGARAAAEGDPAYPLRPMAGRLAAADLTVGNLESSLSDDGAPTQDDAFAASPRVRAGLRAAGFDALSLANNHVWDFGDRALVDTVDLLRGAGLRPFGAGATPREAWRPTVIERHGVRFAFVGFNAIGETPEVAPGRPGAVSVSMPPRTGPLDRVELRRFLDLVRRLDRRADVVTVLPHWGDQYTERPWPEQALVARRLVAAGADLVVGGHPHWVQGAVMVRNALVVHSLGNFVFDMEPLETDLGLVLEATFWGERLVAAEFVPYRIGADHAPRVQPWAEAERTFELFWAFSELGSRLPGEPPTPR